MNDIVMVQVQVNSSAASEVFCKLLIEVRGSFCIEEGHGNELQSQKAPSGNL